MGIYTFVKKIQPYKYYKKASVYPSRNCAKH